MANKVTFYMTIGLPGSGKSTWAKGEMAKDPGLKQISKDDLRLMLDDGHWSQKNEKEIIAASQLLARHFLSRGFSVVSSDTNLSPKHEPAFRQIAQETGAAFVIKDFRDVPLAVCIARDASRPNPVGVKVITDMYHKYIKAAGVPPPDHNPGLPNAIIVDMDGTLATMNGRSPFDWSRVGEDTCRETVRTAVIALAKATDAHILVMSGRDEVCWGATQKWLDEKSVPNTKLFMRKQNDGRRDSIVKRDLYENYIKGFYNIVAVFDDRPQVIRECWQELGFSDRIFNVGTGEEF
jgi:predicted kinase